MDGKARIKLISLVLIFLVLFSLAGADQKSNKVDALFARWNKPDSPGCALAVIHNGRTLYKKGYGQANLEHNIPITPESVFYIGSVSKQFTAMCIALLVNQGKITLEDDIHQHIPELQDFGKPVKIRHLIFHTSGLRDYLTLLNLAGIPFGFYHEKEVLEMLSRQKELNFSPGEEYLYSNTGYFLLSVIVKRVSGKSLGDFAQEKIFKPLGMTHSLFLEDYTRIIPKRATGYFPEGRNQYKSFISTYDCVGAGGLYTSTEDLALWMENFSHGKVGGKDLLEWLQAPGKLDSGKELPYGFALSLTTYKGLKTVSHGGALGGYRSAVLRFPAQNFSVICLANLSSINPMGLAQQVADIYLGDQFLEDKAKPKITFRTLSNAELHDKARTYVRFETGDIIKIFRRGRSLIARIRNSNFELGAVNLEEFLIKGSPDNAALRFENLGPGKPLLLHLLESGKRSITYNSVELIKPPTAQLQEYTGSYYSEELQCTFQVDLNKDTLFFIHKNAPARPFEFRYQDQFSVGNLQLRFLRDQSKKISGFTLDAGRVRNLYFIKRN